VKQSLDTEALRRAACDAAQLGGETARRLFRRVNVRRKSDDTPVTEADHVAQAAMVYALAARYPEHGFIGEEGADPRLGGEPGKSDYCWVIDPLDGTRNFSRGIGIYGSSVAVLHRGEPVAGAIYDATSDRIYSAARGGGAMEGDKLVRIPSDVVSRDPIITVGSFRHRPIPDVVRTWMDRYLLRNFGSIALHLAWVACGFTDAAYALECKLWDLAAGVLMIEEAGGVATDHTGKSLWPLEVGDYEGQDMPILVGAPSVHGPLLASLLEDTQQTGP